MSSHTNAHHLVQSGGQQAGYFNHRSEACHAREVTFTCHVRSRHDRAARRNSCHTVDSHWGRGGQAHLHGECCPRRSHEDGCDVHSGTQIRLSDQFCWRHRWYGRWGTSGADRGLSCRFPRRHPCRHTRGTEAGHNSGDSTGSIEHSWQHSGISIGDSTGKLCGRDTRCVKQCWLMARLQSQGLCWCYG